MEDCPNLAVCGVAQRLEPEAEFELERSGSFGVETFRVNCQAAVSTMLMRRGCSQPLATFGLGEQMAQLSGQLHQLIADIAPYEDCYITPTGVEAVSYSVKRPSREYGYNNLMSQSAIFAPAERQRPVKVIHLHIHPTSAGNHP